MTVGIVNKLNAGKSHEALDIALSLLEQTLKRKRNFRYVIETADTDRFDFSHLMRDPETPNDEVEGNRGL
mgnify:FL=1